MRQPPKTGAVGSAEVDSSEAGALSSGTMLGDRYRIERLLARGGMGVLVAATDLSLDRLVALKFLTGDTLADDKARARFLREARLAAKLRSEHVVKILDVGSVPERGQYIAMELLEGCDLKQHLQKNGPMPVAMAIEILLQACEGIAEAHSHGIIHRDLKSRNLFLARHVHGAPLVKVLDFGISKLALTKDRVWAKRPDDVTITEAGEVMGSPSYMPPEQLVSARDVDARADIFSLGVVLFELITGRLPFRGKTPKDVAVAILGGEPELGDLSARAPEELSRVIARCLARSPSKRFRTVAELAAALEPFAGASSRGAAERVAAAASLSPTGAASSPTGAAPAPAQVAPAADASESLTTTIASKKARTQWARWPALALLVVAAAVALIVWKRTDSVAPVGATDGTPSAGEGEPSADSARLPPDVSPEARAPRPDVATGELPAPPPSMASSTSNSATSASAPAPSSAPSPADAPTTTSTSRDAATAMRPTSTASAGARSQTPSPAPAKPSRVFIPQEPR